MAITEVSKGQVEYDSANPTITLPATPILANDIIFVFCGHGNDVNVSVTTGGYTEICDDLQTSTNNDMATLGAWIRASGGEESTNVVFNGSQQEKGTIGCLVLRGVDATTAIDTAVVHGTHHTEHQEFGDPITLAAYTTTTNGAMLIAISACREDGATSNISSDSGDAEWVKNVPNAEDDIGMLGTREIIAVAGVSGGDVHTWTDQESEYHHGLIFAFRPAVEVGGLSIPVAMYHRRREGIS